MLKKKHYITPSSPFVLFSMGYDGYEGERHLWGVPDKEVCVFHILVRIKHELETLNRRKEAGENDDGNADGRPEAFFPFGTYMSFEAPRTKFIEQYGKQPIDILFTVNQKDLAKLETLEKEPNPKYLVASSRGWRKMIHPDTGGVERMPEEIHTWGDDDAGKPFLGLALARFRYFPLRRRVYLRCKRLGYYNTKSPLKHFAHFTMGMLCYRYGCEPKSVPDRRIVAKGRLVYPYYYILEE